jgi:hypothetical protein
MRRTLPISLNILPDATSNRAPMAEIAGDAILTRAKSLCAQDGFAWELDFTLPYPLAGHLRGSHYPSEQRRQRYLAQARAELLGERQ